MPGRRSRSRSPRRRRRISHSPSTSRMRSDGDRSRYDRRSDREKVASSSDTRTRSHDRHRSSSRENRRDLKPRNVDPPMDSNKVQNTVKPIDQENHREKDRAEQLSQPTESGVRRLRSFVQKEKNVLFPSGSNTVNRGRDRVRDRSVREERGRVGGGRGRQSEGILARESVVEEREVRGQERRQFDIFEDPREVPRSGFFFEHDDRDAPPQSSYDNRNNVEFRRRERRYQRSPSPERRSNDRDFRDRHRYRGNRDTWDQSSNGREWRDQGRGPVRERLGSRSNWSNDRRRGGGGRDRSPVHWKHDLFEDNQSNAEQPHHQERRGGGGRDRSPVHWKHDLFKGNQFDEPEQPLQQESSSRQRLKILEEAVDDFNIDDILSMDNPITKMEFDV